MIVILKRLAEHRRSHPRCVPAVRRVYNPAVARLYRYSQWDGSQEPFEAGAEALLDALAEDVIDHGDIRRALRDLIRRGANGDDSRLPGLDDLLERLRSRRGQTLDRYDMDSVMRDLKERLDDVLQTERAGTDRRLSEIEDDLARMSGEEAEQGRKLRDLFRQRANRNRERLDQLPESTAGAQRELQDFDFIDPEAQRKFQELMDELRKEMLGSVASEMRQQIENMDPAQMAQMREMLRDLNQMIRDKLSGLEPDFEGFMDKWRAMFGDDPPRSFDELMEMLARQMGQMQSLLDSMSPEQRRELFEAMNAAMDPDTADELAELAANLGQMLPFDGFSQQRLFQGEENLTLEQAMNVMGELQSMDDLEAQIRQAMRRGDLDELDADMLEQLLGEEARQDLDRLAEIAKRLEEAGYLQRNGDRLELTPTGVRKIGQKALRDLFGSLRRGRAGDHELTVRGSGGEHTDETKPYEFGDPMEIHLQRTIMNAVERQGAGTPVKVGIQDFEVKRTEHMVQAATVLLIDQSKSMGMFGSWSAAKRVALALEALIRGKFPRDRFWMVGFSDYAVPIKTDELPTLTWNMWVSGTNMQHAFAMSRKLLAPYKGCSRQILMITDGEPTAHLEGMRSYFNYPPTYRTIQETLREVRRCTVEGITINTFMLETSYYLLDFIDHVTRINNGRALYTSPANLGQYVLVDYLNNRKRRIVS